MVEEAPASDPGTDAKPEPDFFDRNNDLGAEIIEALIREGQICAIGGTYGVGKTPLLADMAVHLINGRKWKGKRVQRRPIISIDFESSAPKYKTNIVNIAARLGVDRPRVPDELDVYLENDNATEPATAKLLSALAGDASARLKLIEDALRSKPTALVIIDPPEMLFRMDTNRKTHVLILYGEFRKLLSRYPHAAILLVFNLRKQDKKAERADLLIDPRDWLEEIAGSLDILNRCDVRLGIDFHGSDGVRVINGVRRSEEMYPIFIRPVGDPDNLAGFELAPPGDVDLGLALTQRQKEYWDKLPCDFKFDEVADKIVPRASLKRLLDRAKSAGALSHDERTGRYHKILGGC